LPGHTSSRRGFNLFKALRQHFRSTALCRRKRRDPADWSGVAQDIGDRPGHRSRRKAPSLDLLAASGNRRNDLDGTQHSAFSFKQSESRVEEGRGCLAGGASPRFPSPLIKPDVPD